MAEVDRDDLIEAYFHCFLGAVHGVNPSLRTLKRALPR